MLSLVAYLVFAASVTVGRETVGATGVGAAIVLAAVSLAMSFIGFILWCREWGTHTQ